MHCVHRLTNKQTNDKRKAIIQHYVLTECSVIIGLIMGESVVGSFKSLEKVQCEKWDSYHFKANKCWYYYTGTLD